MLLKVVGKGLKRMKVLCWDRKVRRREREEERGERRETEHGYCYGYGCGFVRTKMPHVPIFGIDCLGRVHSLMPNAPPPPTQPPEKS